MIFLELTNSTYWSSGWFQLGYLAGLGGILVPNTVEHDSDYPLVNVYIAMENGY